MALTGKTFAMGVGAEITVMLPTVIASVLINRLLGPSDRGTLAIVMLMPTVASGIALFQWDRLVKGLSRYGSVPNRNLARDISARGILHGIAGALLGVALAVLYLSDSRLILLAAFYSVVVIPLSILGNTSIAVLSIQKRLKWTYVAKVAGPLSYFIAVGLIVIKDYGSIEAVLIAHALMWLTSVAVAAVIINSIFLDREQNVNIHDALPGNIELPRIIAHGSDILATYLPVWAMAAFVSEAATGVYAAFQIAVQPFAIIFSMLAVVAVSRIAWLKSTERKKHVIVAGLIGVGILISGIVVAAAAGKTIIEIVYGSSYAIYVQMLIPVILAGGCAKIGIYMHTVLFNSGHERTAYKLQISRGALLFIALLIVSLYSDVTGSELLMIVFAAEAISLVASFITTFRL